MKMRNGNFAKHLNEKVIMEKAIRNTNEFMIMCSHVMGMKDPAEAHEMVAWIVEQTSDWMVDEDERHAMDVMIEAVTNVIIDFEEMVA